MFGKSIKRKRWTLTWIFDILLSNISLFNNIEYDSICIRVTFTTSTQSPREWAQRLWRNIWQTETLKHSKQQHLATISGERKACSVKTKNNRGEFTLARQVTNESLGFVPAPPEHGTLKLRAETSSPNLRRAQIPIEKPERPQQTIYIVQQLSICPVTQRNRLLLLVILKFPLRSWSVSPFQFNKSHQTKKTLTTIKSGATMGYILIFVRKWSQNWQPSCQSNFHVYIMTCVSVWKF